MLKKNSQPADSMTSSQQKEQPQGQLGVCFNGIKDRASMRVVSCLLHKLETTYFKLNTEGHFIG